jgi:Leucine-rich repeat (LRR) protein
MFSIRCNNNPLTTLPTLPLQMQEFDCFDCQLTSLPTLPTNLRKLNCLGNPLETLPELPSTLQVLKATLPWIESLEEDTCMGGPQRYPALWPDMVESVNEGVRNAAALTNRQSKRRCMKRCAAYKEQIMMKVWHPSRVEKLIEMGYDHDDM